MQRRSIPGILEEIGALLKVEGEIPFTVKAYCNAAKILAGSAEVRTFLEMTRDEERH